MATSALDRVIAFGRVVRAATKGAAKAILANLSEDDDDDGNPVQATNEEPMFGIGGFYVVPMPPTKAPNGDAEFYEFVGLKRGDNRTVIAGRDLRLNRWMSPVDGDLGIVHYGGGFLSFSWDADKKGSVVMLRSSRLNAQGDAVETAHAITMDPHPDTGHIALQHFNKAHISLGSDGQVYLAEKDAKNWIEISSDGVVITAGSGGIKQGATIVGDPDQAKKVVLLDALATSLQTIATALGKLSVQIMAVPAPGAGIADDVTKLAADIVALQAEASNTLKASTV